MLHLHTTLFFYFFDVGIYDQLSNLMFSNHESYQTATSEQLPFKGQNGSLTFGKLIAQAVQRHGASDVVLTI